MGVPLFDALVWGESSHSAALNYLKQLQTRGYHMLKTRSLYLTLDSVPTDGQTESP